MSSISTLTRCSLVAGLLAVLLIGMESPSNGNPCQPPTPGPCGADGVCRPVRATWGYSQTRWRPWPGEPSQAPTPAEAGPETEGEKNLGPFELPTPEQEDLRGPAKDSKKKPGDAGAIEEAAEGGEAPIEIPEIPTVPAPDALPGFEPQGNQLNAPAPSMDDAPPALPASLREVASSLRQPQRVARQQPAIQQFTPLPLVNPASAIVDRASTAEAESESLQQAIYFEASDQ